MEHSRNGNTGSALIGFALRTVIVLALLAVAFLVWYAARVFFLIFAAVLFAVFLDFVAGKLATILRVGRGWAFAIVVVAIFVLSALAGWVALPRIADQISQLIHTLPKGIAGLQAMLQKRPWGRTVLQVAPDLLVSSNLTSRFTAALQGAAYGLAGLIMIVVVGIYVGANPRVYRRAIVKLFPENRQAAARMVLSEVGYTLQWWIIGQLVPMVALGAATIVGLSLLHIPLAFTLGLFTGLMIFIPYIGALIAFAVTLIVTAIQGATAILSVTLLFIGVHIVEGYLLTPMVQKRAVYLSPALTITSQVLLGLLMGFLGLALATPITAAAVVVVKILYLHEQPEHHT